ncbi:MULTISPECIES: hypothetical protein [unclassified Microcoleus]|uniref:hypothetical protein n=1 Tax=unclassified Microcoleus TaxID=2642155 RepID=UPI002FCF2C00
MKIIKIAHANTTIDTESERESFSIKNYNIESFLLQQEAEIIRQSEEQFAKLLEEEENKAKVKASPIDFIFSFLSPTDKIKDGEFNFLEALSTQFPKMLIRKTIANILPNIASQMEKVEIISLEMARTKYPRSRNLSIGTYTQHPRDGLRLTRLEHYHKNLALEKDDELIVLLGRMGAKSLRIMEIDNEQKSGSINTGVDTVFVDAQGGANLSSKFERNKDLVVTFEGNVVDIDSDLLENSLWFSDDSKLLSIFESRRFNLNKIQEYTLRNTYTETFDFDFNLAAKYLTNQADLNGEYQTISKKERYFHIEFGKLK